MYNAATWLYSSELWYTRAFAKGFRVGVEYQHVGSYFTDPQNTARYDGYDVLNCRAGYGFNGLQVWLHVLNATIGIQYGLTELVKHIQ